MNDALFIQNRRFKSNHGFRNNLDLKCEEKVSKYKLEELHCSLPSSVKSTFIMTFSPDGQRVASTHGDHRIYICDLNTGKLLDTLEGHPKTPWCLAWHPSNREIIASGCLAGEVRVWDLTTKACESWTSENNTIITSLDFHPRERVLVIATANDIHFWDWSESRPFAKTTTTHDKEKVKFVVFDSSGTKLITGISNLPRFSGYTSDSLQNRIIDSYISNGSLEQISTDNMTPNSEIQNSSSGPVNNEAFNGNDVPQVTLNRLFPGINNDEQGTSYRVTLALYRVAHLYRQLESLEDSMRNTSFSPYISPRSGNTTIDVVVRDASGRSNSEAGHESTSSTNNTDIPYREEPPIQQASGQDRVEGRSENVSPSNQLGRTPHASEPLVVSFDESLENLRLPPLIVDGQTISLTSVMEQYPINLSHQMHNVIQHESINQVNQNFIRISKLMSSVRLYRQIVQQIVSANQGQCHFQPNQILTAQSASPRSSRHTSNLPIVFRNFAAGTSVEPNLNRVTRSNDPIMAIQFRNSARNVPLLTVCKIDLLSARTVCIMRSQQHVEQALSSTQPREQVENNSNLTDNSEHREAYTSSAQNEQPNLVNPTSENVLPLYSLVNHLYRSLTIINHAPLTTSNVHTHISSLRSLINKLLIRLTSMLSNQEEGQRLTRLIHDIAYSFTGRSWNIPLGANFDDIRLDVIHTLCIVDLTLHLTRQVQLLQMQRLSAIARIEESRRTNNINQNETNQDSETPASTPSNRAADDFTNTLTPSTSRSTTTKRKNSISAPTSMDDDDVKRRKVENNPTTSSFDKEMIENNNKQTNTSTGAQATLNRISSQASVSTNVISPEQPENIHNLHSDPPADRLVLWNNTQAQSIEQSLQRFLVATASSMGNNHVFVRIYHRLHGNTALSTNNLAQPDDRSEPPHESRRRALSQDNTTAVQQEGPTHSNAEPSRTRQVYLNYGPHGANGSNGLSFEGWQRQPHLHVYQTRGAGQHLWFNQWTIPISISNSNYRIQCWDFSLSTIPNIKDSQSNVVTQKCRIHNDSSIDISSDGSLIACLVPRDDSACLPNFDLKIFSLKSIDFGTCYYQLPHGSNAISVSLSPSGGYAVVGLANNKFINNDPSEDDLTVARVFKLNKNYSYIFVRDIKIKRDDSSLSLNAIRWMSRGIVYNIGPQHHQRYQATRLRTRGL